MGSTFDAIKSSGGDLGHGVADAGLAIMGLGAVNEALSLTDKVASLSRTALSKLKRSSVSTDKPLSIDKSTTSAALASSYQPPQSKQSIDEPKTASGLSREENESFHKDLERTVVQFKIMSVVLAKSLNLDEAQRKSFDKTAEAILSRQDISQQQADEFIKGLEKVSARTKELADSDTLIQVSVKETLSQYNKIAKDTRVSETVRRKVFIDIQELLKSSGIQDREAQDIQAINVQTASEKDLKKISVNIENLLPKMSNLAIRDTLKNINTKMDSAVLSSEEISNLLAKQTSKGGTFKEAFMKTPSEFSVGDMKKGAIQTIASVAGLGPLVEAFSLDDRLINMMDVAKEKLKAKFKKAEAVQEDVTLVEKTASEPQKKPVQGELDLSQTIGQHQQGMLDFRQATPQEKTASNAQGALDFGKDTNKKFDELIDETKTASRLAQDSSEKLKDTTDTRLLILDNTTDKVAGQMYESNKNLSAMHGELEDLNTTTAKAKITGKDEKKKDEGGFFSNIMQSLLPGLAARGGVVGKVAGMAGKLFGMGGAAAGVGAAGAAATASGGVLGKVAGWFGKGATTGGIAGSTPTVTGGILGKIGGLFGKGATVAAEAAPTATGALGKVGGILGKVGGKIPLIGGLISGATTLMTGGSATEAVGSGVGTTAGAGIGAALGTMILPGIGTAIGGFAGGMIGDMLGKKLGGLFNKRETAEQGLIDQKKELSTTDKVMQDERKIQAEQEQGFFATFASSLGGIVAKGWSKVKEAGAATAEVASKGATWVGEKAKSGYAALKSTIFGASDAVGVKAETMTKLAGVESGFKSGAQAGTSSAAGLYQFTDATWKDTVKKYGAKHGIDSNTSKLDPKANALMAAEFTKQNQGGLKDTLGREPTDTETYMAHFLGLGGAKQFLAQMQKNPEGLAANAFPAAAASNEPIFYDEKKQPRSYKQIYSLLEGRLNKFSPENLEKGKATAVANKEPVSTPAQVSAKAEGKPGGVQTVTNKSTEVAAVPKAQMEQAAPSVEERTAQLKAKGYGDARIALMLKKDKEIQDKIGVQPISEPVSVQAQPIVQAKASIQQPTIAEADTTKVLAAADTSKQQITVKQESSPQAQVNVSKEPDRIEKRSRIDDIYLAISNSALYA